MGMELKSAAIGGVDYLFTFVAVCVASSYCGGLSKENELLIILLICYAYDTDSSGEGA